MKYIIYLTIFIISIISNIHSQKIDAVEELDLDQYVGRWFQVYKDAFDMTFEGRGTCAVADYTANGENVTVLNSQIDYDGTLDQYSGFAYYIGDHSGGELTVSLDGVKFPAPYWVVKLGPVINNEYQYSIVSDPVKLSLFVLARDVDEYYEKYDDEVREWLDDNEFTTYNQPLVMDQTDCDYSLYDN